MVEGVVSIDSIFESELREVIRVVGFFLFGLFFLRKFFKVRLN